MTIKLHQIIYYIIKCNKQVGAELCQAQAHVCLPPEAELILSFMEVPSIFSKCYKNATHIKTQNVPVAR